MSGSCNVDTKPVDWEKRKQSWNLNPHMWETEVGRQRISGLFAAIAGAGLVGAGVMASGAVGTFSAVVIVVTGVVAVAAYVASRRFGQQRDDLWNDPEYREKWGQIALQDFERCPKDAIPSLKRDKPWALQKGIIEMKDLHACILRIFRGCPDMGAGAFVERFGIEGLKALSDDQKNNLKARYLKNQTEHIESWDKWIGHVFDQKLGNVYETDRQMLKAFGFDKDNFLDEVCRWDMQWCVQSQKDQQQPARTTVRYGAVKARNSLPRMLKTNSEQAKALFSSDVRWREMGYQHLMRDFGEEVKEFASTPAELAALLSHEWKGLKAQKYECFRGRNGVDFLKGLPEEVKREHIAPAAKAFVLTQCGEKGFSVWKSVREECEQLGITREEIAETILDAEIDALPSGEYEPFRKRNGDVWDLLTEPQMERLKAKFIEAKHSPDKFFNISFFSDRRIWGTEWKHFQFTAEELDRLIEKELAALKVEQPSTFATFFRKHDFVEALERLSEPTRKQRIGPVAEAYLVSERSSPFETLWKKYEKVAGLLGLDRAAIVASRIASTVPEGGISVLTDPRALAELSLLEEDGKRIYGAQCVSQIAERKEGLKAAKQRHSNQLKALGVSDLDLAHAVIPNEVESSKGDFETFYTRNGTEGLKHIDEKNKELFKTSFEEMIRKNELGAVELSRQYGEAAKVLGFDLSSCSEERSAQDVEACIKGNLTYKDCLDRNEHLLTEEQKLTLREPFKTYVIGKNSYTYSQLMFDFKEEMRLFEFEGQDLEELLAYELGLLLKDNPGRRPDQPGEASLKAFNHLTSIGEAFQSAEEAQQILLLLTKETQQKILAKYVNYLNEIESEILTKMGGKREESIPSPLSPLNEELNKQLREGENSFVWHHNSRNYTANAESFALFSKFERILLPKSVFDALNLQEVRHEPIPIPLVGGGGRNVTRKFLSTPLAAGFEIIIDDPGFQCKSHVCISGEQRTYVSYRIKVNKTSP